jgi:hypothetical protein
MSDILTVFVDMSSIIMFSSAFFSYSSGGARPEKNLTFHNKVFFLMSWQLVKMKAVNIEQTILTIANNNSLTTVL